MVKKNDFIEIEYTGKTVDDAVVFDTTDPKVAEVAGLDSQQTFAPITICVGQHQVLPGLDHKLEGKELGKEYVIELTPEDAFGKKDPKLVQLVQTSKFLKQKIQPMPGLQVNIDGMMATIKTVSGGRTMIDFNHPMAGKVISYTFKINKVVTDDSEKLKSYLKVSVGIDPDKVELAEGIAKIHVKQKIPEEITKPLQEKVSEIIPQIKKLEFIIPQEIKK